MLRLLVLGHAERKAAEKVVEYASRPEHHYIPYKTQVPGDLPEHVLMLGTYRCVFSMTKAADWLYRHLSVSVPAPGKLPNQIAAFEIAALFGFTGWEANTGSPPADWFVNVSEGKGCVILAQKVG